MHPATKAGDDKPLPSSITGSCQPHEKKCPRCTTIIPYIKMQLNVNILNPTPEIDSMMKIALFNAYSVMFHKVNERIGDNTQISCDYGPSGTPVNTLINIYGIPPADFTAWCDILEGEIKVSVETSNKWFIFPDGELGPTFRVGQTCTINDGKYTGKVKSFIKSLDEFDKWAAHMYTYDVTFPGNGEPSRCVQTEMRAVPNSYEKDQCTCPTNP
jgi:hypothetical protein